MKVTVSLNDILALDAAISVYLDPSISDGLPRSTPLASRDENRPLVMLASSVEMSEPLKVPSELALLLLTMAV